MSNNQGHAPQPHLFRLLAGGTNMEFREVTIDDPVPTGRQIIEAAGGHPPDEFIVLQWLMDGELKELNLDDTTDLRAPGTEKFIIEKSATTYRFEIDRKRYEWPSHKISREALLAVASQDPKQFSVWQELKNEPDKEVLSGHPAHLEKDGLERFYTVMTHTTEGYQ